MSEEQKELTKANQHLSTANEELVKEVIQKEKQKTNLIQFGTTIGTALTLTAISWLVGSTHGNSEKLARIDERLNIIGIDRYTASDATKDFRIVSTRIDGIETRLNRNANRIEAVEEALINRNN